MAWPDQDPPATDVILHVNVPCAGGLPAYLEIDKLPDGAYGATVGTLCEFQEICRTLVVGAVDRRVKCVVSQVPLTSGHDNVRRLVRPDRLAVLHKMFAENRRGRMAGKPPAMIPVVAEDQSAPSVLPTPDSWTWFTETSRTRAPSWKNEVTLRSVEISPSEPGSSVRFISPTPLLMVVALSDVLTVPDLALASYELALVPKRLVTIRGGHFDAYVADFEAASKAAVEWFTQHLAPE